MLGLKLRAAATMGYDPAINRLHVHIEKLADLRSRITLVIKILKDCILITPRHLRELCDCDSLMYSTAEEVKHSITPLIAHNVFII